MAKKIFSSMELDAIGEIMNISLGSSATAVSNMLDHRVDITTPSVSVVNVEEFTLGPLEPAIGVEIKYITGLEGSNIMLLKMSDVRAITDILLMQETADEDFELNDLALSAVCEVMNQMMGAASTALSDFLGRMVNISTPQTFDANDLETVRRERMPVASGPIVVIQFALDIEGAVTSEFMNVISVDLAKELVAGFGLEEEEEEEETPAPAPAPSGGTLSQEEIERLMGGGMASAPEPAPAPAPAPSGGVMSQEEIERLMGGGMASAPEPAPAPASSGGMMSQEEIERLMGGAQPQAQSQPQPQAQPQPQPQVQPQQQPVMQQPQPGMQQPGMQGMPGMPGGMPGYYPPYPYGPQMGQMPDGSMASYPMFFVPPGYQLTPIPSPEEEQAKKEKKEKAKPAPKMIQTQSLSMPNLEDESSLNEEQSQNLDLIMGVPLEIAVEIGRTHRKVQEILAFTKGSLVVLDKLAGDQVDLYVNGRCIAKGDVVVVEDSFGIRINEILRKPGLEDLT